MKMLEDMSKFLKEIQEKTNKEFEEMNNPPPPKKHTKTNKQTDRGNYSRSENLNRNNK